MGFSWLQRPFWILVGHGGGGLPLLFLLTVRDGSVEGASLTNWEFHSTRLDGWEGRVGKLGDMCNYKEWLDHATPILDAMKEYNRVKKDFQNEFQLAQNAQTTTAKDAYAFVHEVAKSLSDIRGIQAKKVQAMIGKVKGDPNKTASLLKDICDGGELLQCNQIGETDIGTCKCFELPEGRPLYRMKEEEGHCRASVNATCNPDDPVIKTDCDDKFKCTNFTVRACAFAYGPKFHCTGDSEDGSAVGNQNMFCTRPGHQPEDKHDLGDINRGQLGHFGHFQPLLVHLSFVTIIFTRHELYFQ